MSIQKYSLHLVGTEERDSHGRTLLLQAVDNNPWLPSLKGITALLDWGADITARDLEGNTCLHAMINYCDDFRCNKLYLLDILAILIHSGADVSARNFSNESAFDVARKRIQWRPYWGTVAIDMWLAVLRSCGYSPEDVIGPQIAAHVVQFGKNYTLDDYQKIQHWVRMKT
jgi:hypothetical protein